MGKGNNKGGGGGNKGGGGGGGNNLKQTIKSYSSIGPKGIANIKEQFDLKGGVKDLAKKYGVSIKSGGGKAASPFGFEFPGAEGFTPAEFDYQSALNLLNAQGNIDTEIAGINSEASKYIARLQVGSAKDVAEINLQGTKYVADRELEGVLGAENIRARGAIDLQQIVNAGMKDVETIRGEYGVKGKKIDRSTAIMAGLVNAFSF